MYACDDDDDDDDNNDENYDDDNVNPLNALSEILIFYVHQATKKKDKHIMSTKLKLNREWSGLASTSAVG